MGAPINPIRLHNLKIFGCEPSLDLNEKKKKYKTNGDVINPKGTLKLPLNIAKR